MTLDLLPRLLLWGLIATVAMTTILMGSQGLGLSRLSVPFLVGTLFTADRRRAMIVGFIAYVVIQLATLRFRAIHPAMYVAAGAFAAYFVWGKT